MKHSTQSHSLLIRSGHLIDPVARVDAVMDILLRDGQVTEVAPPNKIRGGADEKFDAKGLIVAPDVQFPGANKAALRVRCERRCDEFIAIVEPGGDAMHGADERTRAATHHSQTQTPALALTGGFNRHRRFPFSRDPASCGLPPSPLSALPNRRPPAPRPSRRPR